jgi:hypothetical protein
MDQATTIHDDPFLAALRELPGIFLLPPAIAEALLHLPSQAFDGLRANREPVPPLMTVEGQSGYLAGDLVQYVDQEPSRGPVKIRHASFADFLTHSRPDDAWVFGMVALDFYGMRRPVDLLTCLDLPGGQVAEAHAQEMTLKEYVAVMDGYLSRFADQRAAEELAIERARMAMDHVPPRQRRKKASNSRS